MKKEDILRKHLKKYVGIAKNQDKEFDLLIIATLDAMEEYAQSNKENEWVSDKLYESILQFVGERGSSEELKEMRYWLASYWNEELDKFKNK